MEAGGLTFFEDLLPEGADEGEGYLSQIFYKIYLSLAQVS